MKYGKKKIFAMMLAVTLIVTILTSGYAESDLPLSRIYDILSDSVSDPQTAEDYLERAKVEIGREEYDSALSDLESAVAIAAEGDEVVVEEAKLKMASIYVIQGDVEKAKEILNGMVDGDNSASALQVLVQIDLAESNNEAAAEHLEAYLELQPEDTVYREALAQIYEALTRYADARAIYKALYNELPDEDAYLLNDLRCGFLNGDYEEVLTGFEDYLAQAFERPAEDVELTEEEKSELENKQVYRSLAAFLAAATRMQMGDLENAIAAYKTAIEEGYDEAACYEQIVICAFEQGDYEAVLTYADEMDAKELEASSPALLLQEKGAALMNLERYDEALTMLDQSIAADATLAGNHYYRGMTLLSMENYADAAAEFTLSIEEEYMTMYCYYNRGVAYIGAVDYEAAAEDFGLVLQGDDETLTNAAKDMLWALADYYEQQSTED